MAASADEHNVSLGRAVDEDSMGESDHVTTPVSYPSISYHQRSTSHSPDQEHPSTHLYPQYRQSLESPLHYNPDVSPRHSLHDQRPSPPRRADPRFYHPSSRRDLPSRPQSALLRDHVSRPQYSPAGSRSTSHVYPLTAHLQESPSLSPFTTYTEDPKDHGLTDRTVSEESLPSRTSTLRSSGNHVYGTYDSNTSEDDGKPPAKKLARSLLHVAFLAVPLSIGILVYTLVALLTSLIVSPFGLCLKNQRSLSTRLCDLLTPPLNFQRRCIFATLAGRNSRSSASSQTPLAAHSSNEKDKFTSDSALPLLTTHLLAPVVAVPLMICAWGMGLAWGLGAIVSDERAGDDRDERLLAARVVGWWESWLSRGIVSDERDGVRGRERRRDMHDRGARLFA